MILKLCAVLLALAAAPCLLRAQSFRVNAPFNPETYKPLTRSERFERWWNEDAGTPAIHVESFVTAAYLQAIGDPAAWDRSAGGFVRRLGSSYGSNLIQNTAHESLAAGLGTDPRYFSSGRKGFFRRSGHALKMTFLTYDSKGHETLDVPQLAGIYTSSMVEATWWPHHYTALVQGVQTGHIEVGLTGATHLVQEFSPELKRLIHWRR